LVAKRAGQFAGGFFNNPGVLAAIGLVVGIVTPLIIFRKDIAEFFGSAFGEAAVEGAGAAISSGFESAGENITNFFTSLELPSFELPSFELPSFELPSFELPGFEDIFPPSEDGGDFTEVGMAGARGERGGAGDEPSGFPEEFSIVAGIREPFDIIEETQQEFQERAGAFVEALPEVTAFTSLPGAETDFIRRQISREQEDFQALLDAEARRSETIFAGLFGNVQNPEFGA